MKRWDERPIEIRNLFNPAFCGLVLFRSLSGHDEEDPRGMPFSLALLILPLCLQKDARDVLLKSNRSYFLKVVSSHPQLLVNFGRRATDLLPFTLEALGLLMQLGAFEVGPSGRLKAVPNRVRKSVTGTPESVACQRVARFLGKEFARVADRATIFTTLGIRP
jgi:hypothetical protein